MNPIVAQYLGFVVAALILTWAIIEVSRRQLRRKKPDPRVLNTWIKLDTVQPESADELLTDLENEHQPLSDTDQHIRAQQNGHHHLETRKQP